MSAIGKMTNRTGLCVTFDNVVWVRTQDHALCARFSDTVNAAMRYGQVAQSTLTEIRSAWIGRLVLMEAEDQSRERFNSLRLCFNNGLLIYVESENWSLDQIRKWIEESFNLRLNRRPLSPDTDPVTLP